MIWEDNGYLISKNRYSENSIISEIFTQNHGKVSGIIFGATSKKIRNYLQIGNKIYLNYSSKSENKIGNFKIEIIKAYSPIYFDKPQKLSSILSAMSLIKILTADFQENKQVYNLINDFFLLIEKKNWIKEYILWELKLLKILGYELDLSELVKKRINGNKIIYTTINSEKKIIPNFIIEKNDNVESLDTLLDGLSLVGDYLNKSVFKPNNISIPIGRINFINTLRFYLTYQRNMSQWHSHQPF